MTNYIYVKEAIDERKLPFFNILMSRYGAKLVLNGGLIPGLSHAGTVILSTNTLMHEAMVLALDDHTQSAVAHSYEKQLRGFHKQNARDTEKQANILNDRNLPAMVGHEVLADRPPVVIPDIFFENTNIIGTMNYRVKSDINAYNYNFEITQLNEDGTVLIVAQRKMTNAKGIMDGFVSGAKYMIRCQPIYVNNGEGEWTDYFEIRAN